MKLVSLTEASAKAFGDFEAIRILKEAGYDAIDYSMFLMQEDSHPLCQDDFRTYVREIKAYADSLGIGFAQGHAPFPSYRADNLEYTKKMYPRTIRAIEIAGMLGIPHLVVHPLQIIPKDADRLQINIEFYKSLLPYAKEFNVKLCLENMWGWDPKRNYIIPDTCSWATDFAAYVDAMDSEYCVACLDLGHCGLTGEDAENAIRVLGHDRLQALHVHDNDYHNDTHTLPYYGKMDWEGITRALHDINYQGNLTFEADCFLTPLPTDVRLYEAGARFMQTVGRYLIEKINL